MAADATTVDVAMGPDDSIPRGFAPLRLDVMGGIADYSGALVMNFPLAGGASVEVRPRSDASVAVDVRCAPDDGPDTVKVFPLSHFRASVGGKYKPLEQLGESWRCASGPIFGLVIGAWIEAVRRGLFPDRGNGLTFGVRCDARSSADLGASAAVAAATLHAVARLEGRTVEPSIAASLCHEVEFQVTGLPCGPGDAIAAIAGQPMHLTQAHGCPLSINVPLRVPEGVTFIGLDCHDRDSRRLETFRRVRTTTFMGAHLVNRILAFEDGDAACADGALGRLSMTDYVDRFRDRLPTKLTGLEFLERFKDRIDPWTQVEPDTLYKIRSRTEHHIYEASRCSLFSQRLSQFARTHDRQTLIDAGELMYASHWSQGQRCGMGSPAADKLVTQLRRRGHESGVFGAKAAGRGCGGLVVVMLEQSESALDAVRAGCRDFAMSCDSEPTLLDVQTRA